MEPIKGGSILSENQLLNSCSCWCMGYQFVDAFWDGVDNNNCSCGCGMEDIMEFSQDMAGWVPLP
jgi:hypothetical protein